MNLSNNPAEDYACPKCKSPELEFKKTTITCSDCGAVYAVEKGIPVLRPQVRGENRNLENYDHLAANPPAREAFSKRFPKHLKNAPRRLFRALLAFSYPFVYLSLLLKARRLQNAAPASKESERAFDSFFESYWYRPSLAFFKALECANFKRFPPKGKSAEFGCETGEVSRVIFEGKKINYGCEYVQTYFHNPENAKNYGVFRRLASADLRALPFRSATFDSIYVVHVFDHIDGIKPVVAELARVTRKGGTLAFSTLSSRFPAYCWPANFYATLGLRGLAKRAARAKIRELMLYNFLTREEWRSLLAKNGFEIIEYREFVSTETAGWWDYTYFNLEINPFVRALAGSAKFKRFFKRVTRKALLPFYRREVKAKNVEGVNVFIAARKTK